MDKIELMLKQREEIIISRIRNMQDLNAAEFKEIARLLDCVNDSKDIISQRQMIVENMLEELKSVREEFNDTLKKSEQRILDDIRHGRIYLVDADTDQPLTVALFQKR